MKEQTFSSENLKAKLVSIIEFITKHRLVLIIAVIGLALVFALLRTSSFVDISRNETRYNEELLKINYKEIDTEILDGFKETDQDGKIEVNSNFDPNRRNPFVE